jgi:hypothetical protein
MATQQVFAMVDIIILREIESKLNKNIKKYQEM